MPANTTSARVWPRIALGAWLLAVLPAAPYAAAAGKEPGSALLAGQVALDRAGFSPGLIDGRSGPKTTAALRAYQAARGLPQTGRFDAATRGALKTGGRPATTKYTVTAQDLRDVGPVPRDWNAKARLNRLRYESLTALLAERGHCTQALVQRLNPGRNLRRLRAGDTVILPNVLRWPPKARAAALEVDLDAKTVRALDGRRRTMALFHCSIAKFAEKRPRGAARVQTVAFEPAYTFRPEMWPEVRSVKRVLRIPPGPRNPVGLCWVGLSLPGYGIHGTPNPELIGKTGSHGCIRLSNWDACRLGRMVRPGTPVRFVQ